MNGDMTDRGAIEGEPAASKLEISAADEVDDSVEDDNGASKPELDTRSADINGLADGVKIDDEDNRLDAPVTLAAALFSKEMPLLRLL